MNRYISNGIKSFNKSIDTTRAIMNSNFPTWSLSVRSTSDAFRYIDEIIGNIGDSDSSYRSAEFTLQTGNIFQHDKLYLSSEIDTDTFVLTDDEYEFINQFPYTWVKSPTKLVDHEIGFITYKLTENHYDIGIERDSQIHYNRFNFYDEYIRDFNLAHTSWSDTISTISMSANIPKLITTIRDIEMIDPDSNVILWCDSALYLQDIDMDKDGFISDEDIELYITQVSETGEIMDVLDIDDGEITDKVLELIRYRRFATVNSGWYALSDTDKTQSQIRYRTNEINVDGTLFNVDYEPIKLIQLEDTNDIVYIDRHGNLYFNTINLNFLRNEKSTINIIDFDLYGAYIYFLIKCDDYVTLNTYDLLTYEFEEIYTFEDNSDRRLCCKPNDDLLIWEYDGVYCFKPQYNKYYEIEDDTFATLINHENVTSKIKLMSVFDYFGEWMQCFRFVNESLYQFKNRMIEIFNTDTDNYVDFCNVWLGFNRTNTRRIIHSIPVDVADNGAISDLNVEVDGIKYSLTYNPDDTYVRYGDILIGYIDGGIFHVFNEIRELLSFDGPITLELMFTAKSIKLTYSFYYEYMLDLYRPVINQSLEDIPNDVVKSAVNVTSIITELVDENNISIAYNSVHGQSTYDGINKSKLVQDNTYQIERADDSEADELPEGTYGIFDELSFNNPQIVQQYGTIIEDIEFYGHTDRDFVKYTSQILSSGGSELMLTYTCDPGIYVDNGIKKLFSTLKSGIGVQTYINNYGILSSDDYNNIYLPLTGASKTNTYDETTFTFGDDSQEIRLSIEKTYLNIGQFYVNITPKNEYPGTVFIDSDTGEMDFIGLDNTINPNPASFILSHTGRVDINISDYEDRYGIFRDTYFDDVTYTITSTYDPSTKLVKVLKAYNSNITNEISTQTPITIYESVEGSSKKVTSVPSDFFNRSILQAISLGLISIIIDGMVVNPEDINITNYLNQQEYLTAQGNFTIQEYVYTKGDGSVYSKLDAMNYFDNIFDHARVMDVFTFSKKVFEDELISEEFDYRYSHTNRKLYTTYGVGQSNDFLINNDLSDYNTPIYIKLRGEFYNYDKYINYILSINEDLS